MQKSSASLVHKPVEREQALCPASRSILPQFRYDFVACLVMMLFFGRRAALLPGLGSRAHLALAAVVVMWLALPPVVVKAIVVAAVGIVVWARVAAVEIAAWTGVPAVEIAVRARVAAVGIAAWTGVAAVEVSARARVLAF